MADAETLSRRNFLNTAIGAVGAVITAIIAVPVAGYFIDPALRQSGSKGSWVKLGPAADLSETPKQFAVSTERLDGFMTQKVNATVYAYTVNGEPLALSNTCTHLGCPAAYTEADKEFHCPCHGGVYDITGKNIGGPPPKPLPRFATKIENGDLYVEIV